MTSPLMIHLVEQQAAELRDVFDDVRVNVHDEQVDMAIRMVLRHVAQCMELRDAFTALALLLDAYRELIGPGFYG